MNYDLLPEHMQEGIKLYIEQGIPPGSFMMACLENNLLQAFGLADHINRERLFDICQFIYNEAPHNCHGSPEIVKAWIEKFNPKENENV